MIRFNTAIFYDIENLTKGQSYTNVNSLSLSDIYQKIKALDYVDHISLQRAYANWGDSRLNVLKDEVNSLGIDPIQVFGFAKYHIKNAADIQLVVDAMEINFTRALIDTYVIVSGDGGFASLVKKLHEYSRRVVVCAYGNATNSNLKAVADEFIQLYDPEEYALSRLVTTPAIAKSPRRSGDGGETHSISHGFGRSHIIKPAWMNRSSQEITPLSLDQTDPQLLLSTSKNILSWLLEDEENRQKLSEGGIHLSVIREAFKYMIPDFKPELMGFGKFIELIQFLCHETEVCVITALPNNTLLSFKSAVPANAQALPDLTPESLHTVERYQQLLVLGKPKISTNLEVQFEPLGKVLINCKDAEYSLHDWVNLLAAELPEYGSELIKHFLHTLCNGDVFERHPPELSLTEQSLRLKSEFCRFADLSALIAQVAETKLRGILGEEFNVKTLEACLSCWASHTT